MTVTGLARFDRCTVEKQVEFSNSRFQGRAWFFGAQFKGATEFQQTTFEASATFRDASFKMVGFHGMDSKGAFSLEGVVFDAVPGFVQSHFSEAPLLDTIQIRQMQAKPGLLASGDKGVAARYRALRRLAVQGHDHEREMAFCAAEVRALRGDTDKPLPDLRQPVPAQAGRNVCLWYARGVARYWAGIFYEVFSDFGRSMSRPLLWWGALTLGYSRSSTS